MRRLLLLLPALAACPSPPSLVADPGVLDFGDVVVGEAALGSVQLLNHSLTEVEVTAELAPPFELVGASSWLLPYEGVVSLPVQARSDEVGVAAAELRVLFDGGELVVPLGVRFVWSDHDGDRDGALALDDCDDSDPTVFPGAAERCNGLDDDCDGAVPEAELDVDVDGFRPCEGDCLDTDATAWPGAPEVCDGVDNDCDGELGEKDADGDGVRGCDGDCDESNPLIFPGQPEACDGLDTDCDGALPNAELDWDVDGWLMCNDYVDAGADVLGGGDCGEGNSAIHPGATEVCDGVDGDCDGLVPFIELDLDGDGHPGCLDCDDDDAATNPFASEICDGADNDCDGVVPAGEADGDGDGFGACADCDDTQPAVFPGAMEVCDGLDSDCIGGPSSVEVDGDGDGFLACAPFVDRGVGLAGGDCDDGAAAVHPGAAEGCDGIDTDCDGALSVAELDSDGDGLTVCAGDCNDADPSVFPGATEQCDGVDQDCDGVPAPDEVDGDGDGVLICGGDCDDGDAAISPLAVEFLCDGADNDCDGVVDNGARVEPFFVTAHGEPTVQLWPWSGSGFSAPSTWNPAGPGQVYGAVAGDFDGDGYADFLAERAGGSNALVYAFDSDCQGGFSQRSLAAADGIELIATLDVHGAADVDNDGDLDVIGWNFSDGQGAVWLNDGDGSTWTPLQSTTSPARPFALQSWDPFDASARTVVSLPPADLTGDGLVDLLECTNDAGDPTDCVVHVGDGQGEFVAGPTFSLDRIVNGIAAGDFDGDGTVDLVGGLDDDGDAGQAWIWTGSPAGPASLWSGAGLEVFDLTPDGSGDDDDDDDDSNLVGYGWPWAHDWDGDGDLDLLVTVMDPVFTADVEIRLGINDGAAVFTWSVVGPSEHQWGSSFFLLPDTLSGPPAF